MQNTSNNRLVQELNRKMMLQMLQEAHCLPHSNIFWGERFPHHPGDVKHLAYGHERIIVALDNLKQIRFSANKAILSEHLQDGDILICDADSWCEELWDKPHRMLSVVLRQDYLRVLYIDAKGDNIAPAPTAFFHSIAQPNNAMKHTMRALIASKNCLEAAHELIQALLSQAIAVLKYEENNHSSKESFTWECLRGYLAEHFFETLTREQIAKIVKIHPAHLSRIIRRYAKCSINQYITNLRMAFALLLLKEPQNSIKEIAYRCGYCDSSYFIKVFRRHCSQTPADFRATSISKSN